MMINKRLINMCSSSKKYIIFTIIANWLASICNIFIVLIIGKFIGKVYSSELSGSEVLKNISKLKVWGNISILEGILIIAFLLSGRYLCNLCYVYFSSKASSEARSILREKIYRKLLKLGPGYTNVESTSGVVQVSVEGIEQLEVYFGKYLPQFFYALLVPITLFIFMCFISVKVAVVFILCVPLIPISIITIMKIAKRILKDYWKSYSDLGGTFLENLQGLTTLKVFNVDKERHEKMNEESEKFRKITMKVLSMQLNSITIMDLVAFGGSALGTIVALNEFTKGGLDVGSLLVIILLSSEFFIPLRLLGSYFHIAMNGIAASDRMFKILDAQEKNKKIDDNVNLKDVSIKLDNVTFSYDGKRNVLSDVSMSIKSKNLTAIVGESGSGKSTIASLILNNYSVTEGKILLNNKDIEEINLDKICDNMAIISTNSYIFNGTILDNLLMAKKDASKEEISYALKTARLYDFVNNLKEGVNTCVGEGGNNLSGGQKQRLALARCILADREMIIFDEATSNIDVESEESIWKAIYELSKGKTILVISHRLANVKDADNIYVLNKGSLVESGTHGELMKMKGHYFDMVEKQEQLEKVREVLI